MDIHSFNQMDSAKKRDVLIQSLTRFLEKTDNLGATTRVFVCVTDVTDDLTPKASAPKKGVSEYSFEYKRIGDSFWYSMKWWTDRDKDPRKSVPNLVETVAYDSDSGVQRGFGADAGLQKRSAYHAKILPIQTKGLFSLYERYGRFFSGAYRAAEEFFIPYCLKYRDDIRFEESSRAGEIQIALKNRHAGLPEPCGTRRMWFDPGRGFLLTRVESDLKAEEFRTRRASTVLQARLVGEVWLPERIVEVTMAPGAHAPGTAAVYETSVLDVRLGEVKPKDLEVRFPQNTVYIYDGIQGRELRMGRDGREMPYDGETTGMQVAQQPNVQSSWSSVALPCLSCLGIMVCLVALVYRRRTRLRSCGA